MSINSFLREFRSAISVDDPSLKEQNKTYYKNAIKDLTQDERVNLIKIKQKLLPTDTSTATLIGMHLEDYREAYDSDPTAYISLRNPPRERSWWKSIERFFANLFCERISSNEVYEALVAGELVVDETQQEKLEPEKTFVFTDKILVPPAKPKELINVTPITCEETQVLLDKYPAIRDLAGRDNKTAGWLILASFNNGLPMLNGTAMNDDFKNQLIQVLTIIKDESSEIEQGLLIKRLANGFRDCQPLMQRSVSQILSELMSYGDGFKDQIFTKFHEFKDQILEEYILERHPTALTASDDSPTLQMPHLKSGYLVAFGEQVGLAGVEEAKKDGHKNALVTENLKVGYLEKLKGELDKFVFNLIVHYNNPALTGSRSAAPTISEWLNDVNQNDLPFGFGYHTDDKNNAQLYSNIPEAQEIHRSQGSFYFAPQEFKVILSRIGLIE